MPHTREEFGVYAWDPTNQYYGACLKWHLSFEETPEQVHQLGLDEVERIRGKMLTVIIFTVSILQTNSFHLYYGEQTLYLFIQLRLLFSFGVRPV